MHKHYMSNEAVEAPAAVNNAKNLIEDFYGLPVVDTRFFPASSNTSGRSVGYGMDVYQCDLVSPTGKQLLEFTLMCRPGETWVTLNGLDAALQVAIDNFVNNPKGGDGVLGDWKPNAQKLATAR